MDESRYAPVFEPPTEILAREIIGVACRVARGAHGTAGCEKERGDQHENSGTLPFGTARGGHGGIHSSANVTANGSWPS